MSAPLDFSVFLKLKKELDERYPETLLIIHPDTLADPRAADLWVLAKSTPHYITRESASVPVGKVLKITDPTIINPLKEILTRHAPPPAGQFRHEET